FMRAKRKGSVKIIGVCLLIFCIGYIAVTIREAVITAKERSPEHQAEAVAYSDQMQLKQHVQHFSVTLDRYASSLETNNPNVFAEQSEEMQTVWGPQINEWVR